MPIYAPASGSGDINGDGIINISDVILIERIMMGEAVSSEQKRRADVDSDGIVSIGDVIQVEQFMAGIILMFSGDTGKVNNPRFSVGNYVVYIDDTTQPTVYQIDEVNPDEKISWPPNDLSAKTYTGAYHLSPNTKYPIIYVDSYYKLASLPSVTGAIMLGQYYKVGSGSRKAPSDGVTIFSLSTYPNGEIVYLSAQWINNTQNIQYMGHVTGKIKNPKGETADLTVTSYQDTIAIPMQTVYISFAGIKLYLPGTYQVTYTLWDMNGSKISELTWSFVIQDIPSGAIELGTVTYPNVLNKKITDGMEIPIGSRIQVSVPWINNSINTQFIGHVKLSWKSTSNPVFTEIQPATGEDLQPLPMQYATAIFQSVILDIPQTYVFMATLSCGTTVLSTLSWAMIVKDVLINGEISNIMYSLGGVWEDIGKGVIFGNTYIDKTFFMLATWKNNSLNTNINGHISMRIKRPDGNNIDLDAVGGQDVTCRPSESNSVTFTPFGVNLPGIYKIEVKLHDMTTGRFVTEYTTLIEIIDKPSCAVLIGNIKLNDNDYDPSEDNYTVNYMDKVTLLPQWINNSLNARFQALIKVYIVAPDQSIMIATPLIQSGQIAPLQIGSTEFKPFIADQHGVYRITYVLSYEDVIMSNLTWSMNVIVVGPNRILLAKKFIDTIYQTDGKYGYISEYPGLPLVIKVKETGEIRLIGNIKETANTPEFPVSNMGTLRVYPTDDNTDIAFSDNNNPVYASPTLNVTRIYKSYFITHAITIVNYRGLYTVDLYLGDRLLKSDINQSTQLPLTIYINTGVLPSCRYTVRHGSAFGRWIYRIWGESTKYSRLEALRAAYGFTCDIYDPIFGQNSSQSDSFVFSTDAYKDTYATWKRLPSGMNPSRYPYLSKVQKNSALLNVYITKERSDPLSKCLQAIHILNKYRSMNKSYSGITPLQMGKSIWTLWNGYGIPSPISGDSASGVRTAVFFVLATLLGYKYGNAEMKTIANKIYEMYNGVITSPQAGIQNLQPEKAGWVENDENGLIYRPQYMGSFYAVWKKEGNIFAVTSSNLISEILDFWNMPSEEPGPIVSNSESTFAAMQALRVYSHYALKVDIPNGSYLP